jgi:transcription factor E2F7/8
MNDRILSYNRKAKSLEELSKKFIEHFEGRGSNVIQLDKITNRLGVERRRIYDVINILESLNVVSKKGKNNYEWRGLSEAVRTINKCIREGEDYKI